MLYILHPTCLVSWTATPIRTPKDPKQIGKGGQVIQRIREVSGAGAEVRITDAGKGGDRGGVPAR